MAVISLLGASHSAWVRVSHGLNQPRWSRVNSTTPTMVSIPRPVLPGRFGGKGAESFPEVVVGLWHLVADKLRDAGRPGSFRVALLLAQCWSRVIMCPLAAPC